MPVEVDSAVESKDAELSPTPSLTSTARDSLRRSPKALGKRPWRPYVTPWQEVQTHKFDGSGTEEDPFVVTWLPGQDAEDPFEFGDNRKWFFLTLAGFSTMGVSMGSSIYSAGVFDIRKHLAGSDTDYILLTSLVVLGFALGPLIWGPTSEVLGRRTVHVFSYIPFAFFNVVSCVLPNLPSLLAVRFLVGLFGSAAMVNGGGIVADLFTAEKRGLAISIWSLAPWAGPTIGPIVGGLIADSAGWRWMGSFLAFYSALLAILTVVYLPETYAPTLLRARAKRLSQETGQVYRIERDRAGEARLGSLVIKQLREPWILLFTEPIVAILAAYMAIMYTITYMQFTSFPLVFETGRHWSPALAGLAFCPMATGAILGLGQAIFWQNPRYAKKHQRLHYLPPEERLTAGVVGGVLMPIGLFIFAWTATPSSIPWPACLFGLLPFSVGLVLFFNGVQNYLVDTYLQYAASVLASITMSRSLCGVVFPLFTVDMYTALGNQWAGSVVAFSALIFAPAPYLFYKYGHVMRNWSSRARAAEAAGRAVLDQHSTPSSPSTPSDQLSRFKEGPFMDIMPNREGQGAGTSRGNAIKLEGGAEGYDVGAIPHADQGLGLRTLARATTRASQNTTK